MAVAAIAAAASDNVLNDEETPTYAKASVSVTYASYPMEVRAFSTQTAQGWSTTL